MHGQDQHAALRTGIQKPGGDLDAVKPGHRQIQYRNVGLQFYREPEGGQSIPGLANQLKSVVSENKRFYTVQH